MGRKKRDAPEASPLEQFIGDGGVDAMYQDLPSLLLPLMVGTGSTMQYYRVHERSMLLLVYHGSMAVPCKRSRA